MRTAEVKTSVGVLKKQLNQLLWVVCAQVGRRKIRLVSRHDGRGATRESCFCKVHVLEVCIRVVIEGPIQCRTSHGGQVEYATQIPKQGAGIRRVVFCAEVPERAERKRSHDAGEASPFNLIDQENGVAVVGSSLYGGVDEHVGIE